MTWMEWYDTQTKPSWPPPATISLIWMILYPIILISFGFVFVMAFQGKVPRLVAIPFAINLVANNLVTMSVAHGKSSTFEIFVIPRPDERSSVPAR